MDKKTWLALIGLGISVASNYVQHGSVLAKADEGDATAHALTVLAKAYEEQCNDRLLR